MMIHGKTDSRAAGYERAGTWHKTLKHTPARPMMRWNRPSLVHNGLVRKSVVPEMVQDKWFKETGRKVVAISRIALLAALPVSTGCIHARSSKFVIPSRCVTVNIQSFTEPCTERADGKLVCNGVVITANCRALLPEAMRSAGDGESAKRGLEPGSQARGCGVLGRKRFSRV